MALSDHEQQLLDQMERALYAEDPQFATSLRRASTGKVMRGRAILGVVGIVVGMGILVAGVATALIPLGVLGFLVMLVGGVAIYAALRPLPENEAVAGGNVKAPKVKKSSGFMHRMEDRWNRRHDGP